MDRRRKAKQRKRIDMIGIEQDRDGKAKYGRARKRKRKATQRTATEWHRIATTGLETEKQKYRAGRNPAERKINSNGKV